MFEMFKNGLKASFWASLSWLLSEVAVFTNQLDRKITDLESATFVKSLNNYKKLPEDFRERYEKKKGISCINKFL